MAVYFNECDRYDCKEDREEIKRHHRDFISIQTILDNDESPEEKIRRIAEVVG